MPSIERRGLYANPTYADPANGQSITPSTQDRFTYGGRDLVPICFVNGSTSCGPVSGATEAMPTWAQGWHYYRLEVEKGENLRFFWSPNHLTWVVQAPSGETMEFGVARGSVDTNGIDFASPSDDTRPFRWNLVSKSDAQRLNASTANADGAANRISYQWLRLPISVGPNLIAELSDVYDTPPVGVTAPGTNTYAHHIHFTYTRTLRPSATNVQRARHGGIVGMVGSGAVGAIGAFFSPETGGASLALSAVSVPAFANSAAATATGAAQMMMAAGKTGGGGTPSTSPTIDPGDIAGKSPQEIDQAARNAGLVPKGPDPMAGKGAYVDPVTGEQRVLIHPDGPNPHAHVNDPAGNRLNIHPGKWCLPNRQQLTCR